MNQNPVSRMKRSTRKGTVGLATGAILLAVLILINVAVNLIPTKATIFDVSGIGLTEISGETEKFVSDMKEGVTIYWLCSNGVVDDQFDLLLKRYKEAGKRIQVEVVDTTEHPEFAAEYTDATLSDYSLVIKSGRRHTTVETGDMYYYVNQFVNEQLYSGNVVPLTEAQLTQIYNYCIQYYQIDITQYPTSVYFRGEALITAALDYVTREYIPHGYLLTGHGTATPSEALAEGLGAMGLDVETLDLKVAQSVPVDANCLILFSPEDDLTDHEAALIRDYLNAGGSLMLNTSPEVAENCPNLRSVCQLFGLTAAPGVVEEGDTSFIAGSRFTLVPTVSTEHNMTATISQSGYKMQMPNSHAILSAATLPAGVSTIPLFTTSPTANRVSVLNPSETLGTAGKLHVGMTATKSISLSDGTTDTAYLTWIGSAEALTDTYYEATKGGNYYYYAALVSSMSEPFSSPYENLAASNLSGESLTGLTNGTALLLGAVMVVLLPAVLLTTGIVIWMRRKKR